MYTQHPKQGIIGEAKTKTSRLNQILNMCNNNYREDIPIKYMQIKSDMIAIAKGGNVETPSY
jgi:hypothetical protein